MVSCFTNSLPEKLISTDVKIKQQNYKMVRRLESKAESYLTRRCRPTQESFTVRPRVTSKEDVDQRKSPSPELSKHPNSNTEFPEGKPRVG